MKILAFYLPQFHEIPENNEWWREGFTEWICLESDKKNGYSYLKAIKKVLKLVLQ